MLADKITELRKKHGMSLEALSEIVDVSKLTISKWESGISTPNLEEIIMMSNTFGVSTDYLIKEESVGEGKTQYEDAELRSVSLDEVTLYLENKSKVSKLISKGVILSIFSFMPLMILLTLSGQNKIKMSMELTTAVGLIVLFALVSISIVLFVKTNHFSSDFEKIERKAIELESRVKRIFIDTFETYKPVYFRRITFSVILIVMSAVPLITVSLLTRSDTLLQLMVVTMMLMIGLGIYIIMVASMYFNTLQFIVKIGDHVPQRSKYLKRIEKVAAFYWPLVLAVYMGWSLWTMAWGTTWILWPVAAISFVALVGFIGLFDSDD